MSHPLWLLAFTLLGYALVTLVFMFLAEYGF